jgi:anti-anti-sigma factor
MKVTVQEDLQNFVIKPQGKFEEGDCYLLRDALERSTRCLSRHVLVDLKDLQNITTAGQRILLSYSTQLQALRRPLVLFDINPVVLHSFEDSGLNKVISIANGLTEAKALAQGHK